MTNNNVRDSLHSLPNHWLWKHWWDVARFLPTLPKDCMSICVHVCVSEAAGAKPHLCIARSNPNLWFCFEEIHYTHFLEKEMKVNKSRDRNTKFNFIFYLSVTPSGKCIHRHIHTCACKNTDTLRHTPTACMLSYAHFLEKSMSVQRCCFLPRRAHT